MIRAGPVRGARAPSRSSALRPCSGPCSSATAAPISGADHEVVDDGRVGVGPGTLDDQGEASEHLPLVELAVRQREHWLRPVGDVAHPQLQQGDVVVRLLQRRRRREDDVGVPRRLVAVDVDGHDQLERPEGGVEAPTVGQRQHGVAGDAHERLDLPRPRRLDLLGEAHGGQLAERAGKVAHARPGMVGTNATTDPRRAVGVAPGDRGRGEHRPAWTVEVAGADVEHVDEPAGDRAELGGRRPDASVHGGPRRGDQLPGETPNRRRLDTGDTGDLVRTECCQRRTQPLQALDVRGHGTEVDEPLVEQHPHHCGKEERV